MIYLFDHTENFLGMLSSKDLVSPNQVELLNGRIQLEVEIEIQALEKMKGVSFLAHKSPNEEEDFYFYKLVSVGNTGTGLVYRAIDTFLDDMKGYGYLREYRMEKTTAGLALGQILHGSRWRVNLEEPTEQKDLYIYDLSRFEAIKKLLDTFSCELEYKVKIEKNKIVDRYVNLYRKRGRDTYKRFHYGTNALEVVREEDQQDIYTAVIGRGKGEEKFDTTGQATGGFGRRINFKDVEWSKEKGNPLDKPLGQEYIEDPKVTKVYGYSDGTPRYKLIVHDQIEDPEELLEACYQDLVNGSRPLVQFKASLADVGRLELGDRVRIIREDLDIYYTARVFKVTRDLLNPDNAQIELGDNLEYGRVQEKRSLINQLESLNNRVTEVASSANSTFMDVIKEMREGLKNSYFNEDGYNYEFKTGNPYGLPAGYYSFDKPIDKGPTKVIYMGAGKMMIANRKDASGDWEWKTFGTGDGLMAETIVGTLGEFAKVNAEQITVNSHFADTDLGKKVVVQDELYNNVKITQAKGVQVLDNQARERVQMGNWASGRYGLKLTDASGNRTILDDNGIMQSWQDGRCDNADPGHPLKFSVYLPKETARLYKASLRIYLESFRAYSKALTTQSAKYPSTESGGYQNASTTSDSGGGDYGTTHGAADVDMRSNRYYVQGGSGGYVDVNQTYYHEHKLSIDPHTHDVDITIEAHTHDFTIPGHSHEIVYGIYEESNSDNRMEIFINGSDKTSSLTGSGYFSSDQEDLDVTKYLEKGRWNVIEIKTSQRMRIDATIFIQALLNYGGY